MNRNILDKLDQRAQRVVSGIERKGYQVKELNDITDQVKFKVYEEDEQKKFNVFHKNYKRDELDDKRT